MRYRYRSFTGGPDPLADPLAERPESVPLREAQTASPGGADPEAGSEAPGGLLAPPGADRHGLSPRELRRLADTALRDLERSSRGRVGGHRAGAAPGTEPTGTDLPWEGDDRPLAPVATVRAAALRRSAPAERAVPLRAEDLRAAETEPVGAAAVSLLVDLSHSMVVRGLHDAATRTALALDALVRAHHPGDRLRIIGFGESARVLTPGTLVAHRWRDSPGTNLHHALRLARAHARRHRGLPSRVFVVTDGEPTAHVDGGGLPRFAWPPDPRTAEATLAELDALVREDADTVFFLLADEPGLRDFAARATRRRGVRLVRADAAALGPLVVGRYLREP
ncbi:VWA domain-containing protein [Nocardiopsis sp. LOL_012]|uniref:VWA domain-containing protein n=1 Tax=Nocardiopsis sp. LOL_012 TaxID=3345409 RepID=UPI003A8963C2